MGVNVDGHAPLLARHTHERTTREAGGACRRGSALPPGYRRAGVYALLAAVRLLSVVEDADHFFSAHDQRTQMLDALTDWMKTSLAD